MPEKLLEALNDLGTKTSTLTQTVTKTGPDMNTPCYGVWGLWPHDFTL